MLISLRNRRIGTFGRIALVMVSLGILWAAGLVLPATAVPARAAREPLVAGRPIEDYLDGSATVPDDFPEVMGYRPVEVHTPYGTRMAAPGGSCSSPMGDAGPFFDFTYPCKTHDLGYDLLRYADRVGPPPAPGARLAVDRRFRHDMHRDCAAPGTDLVEPICDGWANIYTTAVTGNSVRQSYGVP